MPAERVKLLREAFNATLRDLALVEEARRLKLELDPLDGAALQAAIAGSAAAPEVVARARRVAER